MRKHTPGKWQVVGGTVIVSKSLDKMIASVPEESVSLSFDETRANAELIARAPKMQSAIRAAIKKLDGPGMPHRAREVITMLREAVDET